MKNVERRKTLLIQKDVQIGFLKLISILYLFVLLIVSFFWLAIIVVILKQLDIDYLVVKEIIVNNSKYISLTLLIQITTMLVVIYYLFARFTLKICGPIFSIGRSINKMNHEKTISSVQIRKDDFYQEFAKELNQLLQNVSEYKQDKTDK